MPKIPTLKEIIGLVRKSGDQNVRLNIETKIDPNHPEATAGCRFLVEPYVHGKATGECPPSGGDLAPIHIPAGRYLMLGDNRTDSNDGRCWGLIRDSQIIGPAVFRYWPFGRLGPF